MVSSARSAARAEELYDAPRSIGAGRVPPGPPAPRQRRPRRAGHETQGTAHASSASSSSIPTRSTRSLDALRRAPPAHLRPRAADANTDRRGRARGDPVRVGSATRVDRGASRGPSPPPAVHRDGRRVAGRIARSRLPAPRGPARAVRGVGGRDRPRADRRRARVPGRGAGVPRTRRRGGGAETPGDAGRVRGARGRGFRRSRRSRSSSATRRGTMHASRLPASWPRPHRRTSTSIPSGASCSPSKPRRRPGDTTARYSQKPSRPCTTRSPLRACWRPCPASAADDRHRTRRRPRAGRIPFRRSRPRGRGREHSRRAHRREAGEALRAHRRSPRGGVQPGRDGSSRPEAPTAPRGSGAPPPATRFT